eukprot:jgi/Chrzof1/10775/Cz05g11220.t1
MQQANLKRRQFLQRAVIVGCACCTSLLLPTTSEASEGSFSYGGASGPSTWGGTCQQGTMQSPINIGIAQMKQRPLPKDGSGGAACNSTPSVVFQYNPASQVRILNTGTGTMQVNFEPGNICWIGDDKLELVQYHFHTPSEHSMDGQRTAMEAHLLHRNTETGALAVLATLLQPTSNQDNQCLQVALQYAPTTPRAEAPCPVLVNPMQLIPEPTGGARHCVHYIGSLTTPPCSEQVDWCVFEQPVLVTAPQVLSFMRFAGGGSTYGQNARPVQPENGRQLQYDCFDLG